MLTSLDEKKWEANMNRIQQFCLMCLHFAGSNMDETLTSHALFERPSFSFFSFLSISQIDTLALCSMVAVHCGPTDCCIASLTSSHLQAQFDRPDDGLLCVSGSGGWLLQPGSSRGQGRSAGVPQGHQLWPQCHGDLR